MMRCWDAEPSNRPSFEEIRVYLAKCLEYMSTGYGYMGLDEAVETEYIAYEGYVRDYSENFPCRINLKGLYFVRE